MKNIKIFNTRKEYKDFILEQVITTAEIQENRFYKNLIEFIIDHRAPLFFDPSEDYEYAHFTQSFSFTLLRPSYDNRVVEDMYYVHDFIHELFWYPLRPRDLKFPFFKELMIGNEYVAANETEMLTYYRLPKLRSKTFNEPILYDTLKKKYSKKPDVSELYAMRQGIIEQGKIPEFLSSPENQRIIAFLKKFNANNAVWCKLWYDSFPELIDSYMETRLVLEPFQYEHALETYVPIATQEQYEKNILHNVRTGLAMMGISDLPQGFSDCHSAIQKFEGRIIMKDTAKAFHDQYIKSKKNEK